MQPHWAFYTLDFLALPNIVSPWSIQFTESKAPYYWCKWLTWHFRAETPSLQENTPLECKNPRGWNVNGNINFLEAFLDGLPTPERSERLEVKKDDSSTAQNPKYSPSSSWSFCQQQSLPPRMRSPLSRVHFEIRVGLNRFWAAMLTLFWASERREL